MESTSEVAREIHQPDEMPQQREPVSLVRGEHGRDQAL